MRTYLFDRDTPTPREPRKYKRQWNPNMVCGANPIEPKPFKVIYIPMENRR